MQCSLLKFNPFLPGKHISRIFLELFWNAASGCLPLAKRVLLSCLRTIELSGLAPVSWKSKGSLALLFGDHWAELPGSSELKIERISGSPIHRIEEQDILSIFRSLEPGSSVQWSANRRAKDPLNFQLIGARQLSSMITKQESKRFFRFLAHWSQTAQFNGHQTGEREILSIFSSLEPGSSVQWSPNRRTKDPFNFHLTGARQLSSMVSKQESKRSFQFSAHWSQEAQFNGHQTEEREILSIFSSLELGSSVQWSANRRARDPFDFQLTGARQLSSMITKQENERSFRFSAHRSPQLSSMITKQENERSFQFSSHWSQAAQFNGHQTGEREILSIFSSLEPGSSVKCAPNRRARDPFNFQLTGARQLSSMVRKQESERSFRFSAHWS